MKSKVSKILMLLMVVILLAGAGCQPQATPTQSATEAVKVEPTKEMPAEVKTEPAKVEPTMAEPTKEMPAEVTEEPKEPVVLRQPANEPSGLDPALGGYGYQEFINLYETLVDSFSPNGESHAASSRGIFCLR